MKFGARYSHALRGWFYTFEIDGISHESFNYYPSKHAAIKAGKREWK